MRTYEELMRIPTFKERYEYLRLDGEVGKETFGFDRWLNQQFYHSTEWRRIRNQIIVRDTPPGSEGACDMGLFGYPISGRIYVHHMNPIAPDDIVRATEILTNPNYLICVSYDTHQAITYGAEALLPKDPIERRPGDTCPWKRSQTIGRMG